MNVSDRTLNAVLRPALVLLLSFLAGWPYFHRWFTSTSLQRSWSVKTQWVKTHEAFLASDALGGRGSATRDEAIAAEYVGTRFEGFGLRPAPGMQGFVQKAAVHFEPRKRRVVLGAGTEAGTEERWTYNAVGFLPGRDANAETVLLTAHLDHLGSGKAVNGDSIYNGADDDAAGTTTVIELAHALASLPRTRRSVLFVCFGSEEQGAVGSTYFRTHPPVPLARLVANIEFEMIGAQDPKLAKGFMLFIGWDRSNLGPVLRQHGALLAPDPYPEQNYFRRSDNYALAQRGVVAHTAAGWGDPPFYHQPSDDMQHVDLSFLTEAIQSMVQPIRWLANSSFKPTWNPGKQPERAAD